MGYVSDFSPDGKLFALLDSDGRLKIWDVKNNFLARPNHHLGSEYVCFTWTEVCTKDAINDCQYYIAMGKAGGGVDLYSYETGSIKCTLSGNGHTGPVTSICSHNSLLYTCGKDRRIVGWSLECDRQFTCSKVIEKQTPTSIISLQSNYVLVACRELCLWSLPLNSKPKMESKFTGHSTDVSSMKMVKQMGRNAVYVVSSAGESREIFLWKINATKFDAEATVLMKYAANFIGCSILGNKLMITAVNEGRNGPSVDLFITADMRKMKKIIKITLAVKCTDSADNPQFVPIVVAALDSSNNSQTISRILIGYGNCSSLRFEEMNTTNRNQKLELPRHDPRIRESALTYVSDVIKIGGLRLALDQGDDSNLRAIFCIQDKDLICSTVAQLPEEYLLRLVEELTLLIQRKIFNVGIAKCWLDPLVRILSSNLMLPETNELDQGLRSLLGLIQYKILFLQPLARLNGQLNLLLSQRMMNENGDRSPLKDEDSLGPLEDEGSLSPLEDEDLLVPDIIEQHHMVEWEDDDGSTDEEGYEINCPE